MTKIEWADKVWNPVTGCTKVSAGCKNCYAETIAKRFWGDRKFTDVQIHHDRLEIPIKCKKPTRYFVNSMSDLFHKDVPYLFIQRVFAIMALCPQHEFLVLTKRQGRMWELMEAGRLANRVGNIMKFPDWVRLPAGRTFPRYYRSWPLPNVMLGVSVEDQAMANERIPLLLQTPAAKRFVSYEPALDRIAIPSLATGGIDLIIMGGESGPGFRPMNLQWARSVRDQCKAAGVPFFFKQTSGKGPIPKDLMIRQWPK